MSIKVVYVQEEKSWVHVFPSIIHCVAPHAKMNEAFRAVIIGGLEHPNNVVKREKGFTAMVMDSSDRPLFVYTENAATDAYDMKMEYNCSLNLELLPSFGTVRPGAFAEEG